MWCRRCRWKAGNPAPLPRSLRPWAALHLEPALRRPMQQLQQLASPSAPSGMSRQSQCRHLELQLRHQFRSMLALCPQPQRCWQRRLLPPPARSRFSSPPGAASGDPGDPGGTCGGAASGDCPSPAPSAAGIDAADGQSLHVVLFEGWVEPNSCSTLGHPRPCPRGHPGPRDPPPGLPWGYPRGYPLSSGTSPG